MQHLRNTITLKYFTILLLRIYLAKRTQQYSSVKKKEALPLCSISKNIIVVTIGNSVRVQNKSLECLIGCVLKLPIGLSYIRRSAVQTPRRKQLSPSVKGRRQLDSLGQLGCYQTTAAAIILTCHNCFIALKFLMSVD